MPSNGPFHRGNYRRRMLREPDSLAGVFGEHGALASDDGGDVHDEIRGDELALAIASGDRIHEIEMRDAIERRGGGGDARVVVGSGGGEAGVADEGAGGLVIAEVIDGRCGEDEIGADFAESFGDAAARGVVGEDGEVAEFQAEVARADERGSCGGLAAAHGGDFLGRQLLRAAIAGGEGGDGEIVAEGGEQSHGAAGQKLDVVGMGVDCEDTRHGPGSDAADENLLVVRESPGVVA